MARRTLILASSSPARLAMLRAAGIEPEVMVSGVPEDGVEGLAPTEAVRTLAERKADAIAFRLARPRGEALVLGCDSLLAFEGGLRGKPSSAAEARSWWRHQRGKQGTLFTGHALLEVGSRRRALGVSDTVVRFGEPTDAEIDAYVATGEPLRVAGAFTLDGRGAPFVDGIDGDPGTVVGLSLPLLRRLVAELGGAITDLWTAP